MYLSGEYQDEMLWQVGCLLIHFLLLLYSRRALCLQIKCTLY